jgi:HSP20 family protein
MLGRSFNSTLDRMLTLNRVLDEALSNNWNGSTEARSWAPALDVVERHDAYLVALEVPGVDPSTIEVSFEQTVRRVRGSKPMGFELHKDSELRVYSSERVVGDFERSLRLPDSVNGEDIIAEFKHGVLFLTVPKVQAAQPRKIPVTVLDGPQKQIDA